MLLLFSGAPFQTSLTGRVQGLDLRSWTKKRLLCHHRSQHTGVTTDEPPTPLDRHTLHPKTKSVYSNPMMSLPPNQRFGLLLEEFL